jgi:hypothetical protein
MSVMSDFGTILAICSWVLLAAAAKAVWDVCDPKGDIAASQQANRHSIT